ALISLLLGACDISTLEQNNKPITKSATKAETISSGWEAHIADYPKRWVATEAPLFIRFTHPVIEEAQVNSAINSTWLELDTNTPVSLLFTSTTELRIQPIERLPSDSKIRFRLNTNNLQGIDKSFGDFEFEVQTIKQDFDLRVDSLSAMSDD